MSDQENTEKTLTDGGASMYPISDTPAGSSGAELYEKCVSCHVKDPVIKCTLCDRHYCYNVLWQPVDTANHEACISIPVEMTVQNGQKFQCPSCIALDKNVHLDYIIRRGPEDLVSRTWYTRASVILVLFYLETLQEEAYAIREKISASLGALHVHIVIVELKLQENVQGADAEQIREQLIKNEPHHLVVIFLTESNRKGGWYVTPERDTSVARCLDEHTFIESHTSSLSHLARKSVTCRIFPIVNSTNLFNNDSLGTIFHGVNIGSWQSVVLPTARGTNLKSYTQIFPNLFIQLYYAATPLRTSLLQAWAHDLEARKFTGLILMERQSWRDGPLVVSLLNHAPNNICPFGVFLPAFGSICGHLEQPNDWECRQTSIAFGEQFYFFASKCCSHELHVAIYTDKRKLWEGYGTTIMEEFWNPTTELFSFNFGAMVAMITSPARKLPEKEEERPRHDAPWTLAGRGEYEAKQRQLANAESVPIT